MLSVSVAHVLTSQGPLPWPSSGVPPTTTPAKPSRTSGSGYSGIGARNISNLRPGSSSQLLPTTSDSCRWPSDSRGESWRALSRGHAAVGLERPAYHRLLKLAWAIADLAGSESVEASQYRSRREG